MMNEDFLRKLREEGKLELSDPIKLLKSMEVLYSMGYVFNGAEWVKSIEPRTKVVYEKVDTDSGCLFSLYDEWDSLSLYRLRGGEYEVIAGTKLFANEYANGTIYRKVEKEIDWQVEAEKFRKSSELKYYDMDDALQFPKDHHMAIDFVKMCHLVASLTDKPE